MGKLEAPEGRWKSSILVSMDASNVRVATYDMKTTESVGPERSFSRLER
jgi:hypothetical protein